jgi:hypothetical protein
MFLRLINQVLYHEDTWVSVGIAPPFLTSALHGSGQPYVPAALLPGKDPPAPIG